MAEQDPETPSHREVEREEQQEREENTGCDPKHVATISPFACLHKRSNRSVNHGPMTAASNAIARPHVFICM